MPARWWDKRLAFNGGEVYYTNTVTQDEANRLGEYLVECEFFDGNPKSVQLNRTDDAYEFRMVVKKGADQDSSLEAAFMAMSYLLSSQVLDGQRVDIHLTDERFNTLRVIDGLQ